MKTTHVAVWIDHKEARLYRFEPGSVDETTVAAPHHSIHNKHPRGSEGPKAHPDDAKRFFHEVARALEGAEEILVVGPSTAKLEMIRYLHHHEHTLEQKIVGVETVDHPTDAQIVAYARQYFERFDAARPLSAR
jgi:stalled ribosome rescue protein Dom34